jgi:hypothetical protein
MAKIKGYKKLDCKMCGETVQKVDIDATAITCSSCVQRLLGSPAISSLEEWNQIESLKKD